MSSSVSTRSPRTAQHRQPVCSSTKLSSLVSIRSWSSPTSPNSLMITAVREKSGCLSRRPSSVVLPLPRKPVSTATGIMAARAAGARCAAAPADSRDRRRPARCAADPAMEVTPRVRSPSATIHRNGRSAGAREMRRRLSPAVTSSAPSASRATSPMTRHAAGSAPAAPRRRRPTRARCHGSQSMELARRIPLPLTGRG